jgi:hypothetical protein
MPEQTDVRSVRDNLFCEPDCKVFAVLDGASVPGLPARLYEDEPEYVCLYRGDLAPDLAETAPYLARLEPESKFTEWLIGRGWGEHWGIFAAVPADLRAMRLHFRRFTIVMSPENKPLYFRYYDPRVLRTYLPTCNAAEAETVFGPISFYAAEGEDPDVMLRFRRDAQGVRTQQVRLAPAADATGVTGSMEGGHARHP